MLYRGFGISGQENAGSKPDMNAWTRSGLTQVVADTLSGMAQVKHYSAIWRGPSNEFDPFPLHTKVWRTLSPSLQSLSLSAPLESFVRFTDASPCFPNLRSLSLNFIWSALEPHEQELRVIKHVVPLVNSHSATLDTLHLSSRASVITDAFYDRLDPALNLSHIGFGPSLNNAQ